MRSRLDELSPPARDRSSINELRTESPRSIDELREAARHLRGDHVLVAYKVMAGDSPVVGTATRVDEVARKIRKAGSIPAVVTDGDGHARGIITSGDIAMRVCSERRAAENTQAVAIMSSPVIRCEPLDDLETVMLLMLEHRISHVLVTSGPRGLFHGVVDLGCLAVSLDGTRLKELLTALLTRKSTGAFRFDHAQFERGPLD